MAEYRPDEKKMVRQAFEPISTDSNLILRPEVALNLAILMSLCLLS